MLTVAVGVAADRAGVMAIAGDRLHYRLVNGWPAVIRTCQEFVIFI